MRGDRRRSRMVQGAVILCLAVGSSYALASQTEPNSYPLFQLEPLSTLLQPAEQAMQDLWRITNAPQQPATDSESKTTSAVFPDPPETKIPLSLKTRYQEHQGSMPGVEFNPAQLDTYWDMKLRSEVSHFGLKTENEIAFSYFDPDARDGFGEAEDRSMKLGVSGKLGSFSYGTRYRSIGKDFHTRTKKEDKKLDKDQERWEVWSSWWSGKFGIKTAAVTKQDNLHNNPNKPRFSDQQAQATLTYQWSDWPSIGYSLSYGSGTRKSTYEPEGYQFYEGPTQSLDSSLYYSSDSWYASVDSYWVSTEDLTSNRGYELMGHSLSTSCYPSPHFSISPSISIDEEFYEEDSSHSLNRSLSVSLDRAFPKRHMGIEGYVSYYDSRNDAWGLDTDGVYGEAGMTWSLDKKKRSNRKLGLYVTYNRYRDHVYDGGDVDDVTAWLVFRTGQKRRSWYSRPTAQQFFDTFPD